MAAEPTEYQQIEAKFADAKARAGKERISRGQRRLIDRPTTSVSIRFKTQYLLVVLFFLWFMYDGSGTETSKLTVIAFFISLGYSSFPRVSY